VHGVTLRCMGLMNISISCNEWISISWNTKISKRRIKHTCAFVLFFPCLPRSLFSVFFRSPVLSFSLSFFSVFFCVFFSLPPKMILPLLFMRAPIPFFLFLIDIYFLKENPVVQFLGRLRGYSLTHSHLLINSFFF